MSSDHQITAQFWGEHTNRFSDRDAGLFWWEAGPEIQERINRKISGDPESDYTTYTLNKYFDGKLPLNRCLSLGCGTGGLERSLASQGAFQHCDAYDITELSIIKAKERARIEGLDNIYYIVADINKINLPLGIYDSVWIQGSLHHIEALEHVCDQIRHALKPDGLLILNEYIGPSRFQFSSRQKEVANLCLQLLPKKYRVVVQEAVDMEFELPPPGNRAKWFVTRIADKIKDGDLINTIQRRFRSYKGKLKGQKIGKATITFPSVRDVIAADPSEAVRSDEIIKVLQHDFEILEKTDLGGNVLQFLLSGIAGNFSSEDQLSQALLKMIINIEETLIQSGEFESDFAYITARPKPRVEYL